MYIENNIMHDLKLWSAAAAPGPQILANICVFLRDFTLLEPNFNITYIYTMYKRVYMYIYVHFVTVIDLAHLILIM